MDRLPFCLLCRILVRRGDTAPGCYDTPGLCGGRRKKGASVVRETMGFFAMAG